MKLLCTNDDGILAHGLACLIRAAEPLGEVSVVAPDREQSATSHSLTLHHPLRPALRAWIPRELKNQCAGATAATYVTKDALQHISAVEMGIAYDAMRWREAQTALKAAPKPKPAAPAPKAPKVRVAELALRAD